MPAIPKDTLRQSVVKYSLEEKDEKKREIPQIQWLRKFLSNNQTKNNITFEQFKEFVQIKLRSVFQTSLERKFTTKGELDKKLADQSVSKKVSDETILLQQFLQSEPIRQRKVEDEISEKEYETFLNESKQSFNELFSEKYLETGKKGEKSAELFLEFRNATKKSEALFINDAFLKIAAFSSNPFPFMATSKKALETGSHHWRKLFLNHFPDQYAALEQKMKEIEEEIAEKKYSPDATFHLSFTRILPLPPEIKVEKIEERKSLQRFYIDYKAAFNKASEDYYKKLNPQARRLFFLVKQNDYKTIRAEFDAADKKEDTKKFLINFYEIDANYNLLLSWAIRLKHLKVLDTAYDIQKIPFLNKNGSVDTQKKDPSFYNQTLLHTATACGQNREIIENLLGKKADVEARNSYCRTPLMNAVDVGHIEGAEILLAFKAQVNAHTPTALFLAAQHGHLAIAKLLIETYKADVNIKTDVNHIPVIIAARLGRKAIVNLLIENKAEINAKTSGGGIPLHYAAEGGHETTVKLLLDHKADVTVKTSDGRTAFETSPPFNTSSPNIKRMILKKQLETFIETFKAHDVPRSFLMRVFSSPPAPSDLETKIAADLLKHLNENTDLHSVTLPRNFKVSNQLQELFDRAMSLTPPEAKHEMKLEL